MNRTVRVLKDTLKQFTIAFMVFLIITIVDAVVFWLYNSIFEPLFYASLICVAFLLVLFVMYFLINLRNDSNREHLKNTDEREWINNLEPKTLAEEDYCEMLKTVLKKFTEYDLTNETEKQNMLDYYTSWVHQIKTPISVMRLELKSNDTEENRVLLGELFRIERYVDMVLQYVRLDSNTNDLVIGEYPLDDIIRECIRKYASQFISAKVKLEYEGTDKEVITDRKWLSVIIEQLLSNAVKYAPEGKVEIKVTDDNKLIVEDNGIGIRPEDLPRVFEKGYTGNNGRLGMNSSGLGLYLSKKAADKIKVPISVESELSKGTKFTLDLNKRELLKD